MFGKPIFEVEVVRHLDDVTICHVPSKSTVERYYLHCETGPAIKYVDSDRYYFANTHLPYVKSVADLQKYIAIWKMNRVLDK